MPTAFVAMEFKNVVTADCAISFVEHDVPASHGNAAVGTNPIHFDILFIPILPRSG